jgi:hypothetical protein
MSTNSEQSAYPIEEGSMYPSRGLTKREHYAGIILQGLLSNTIHYGGTNDKVMVVGEAIALADELLKQLDNK